MITHLHAYAQDEYRIPCYIPKHSVRISNRYTKISPITPLVLHKEVQNKALLWRDETDDIPIIVST